MFRLKLNLYRYLFILRITDTMIIIPRHFPVEVSYILGSTIAGRLPTIQARPWLKSMKQWESIHNFRPEMLFRSVSKKQFFPIPCQPWPIEAVILIYPCGISLGQDQLLLMEMKFIGQSADHGFFLETILPAIEELGRKPPIIAGFANRLWGAYQIDSVYISEGGRWHPVAEQGSLDLGYNPKPNQWTDGLTLVRSTETPLLDKITWFTPYSPPPQTPAENGSDYTSNPNPNLIKPPVRPSLPDIQTIFEQFIIRLEQVTPGKAKDREALLDGLTEDELLLFEGALDTARRIKIRKVSSEKINMLYSSLPIGTQTFATAIPDHLIPFLTLASVLHIGQHTHFGCGTFFIE